MKHVFIDPHPHDALAVDGMNGPGDAEASKHDDAFGMQASSGEAVELGDRAEHPAHSAVVDLVRSVAHFDTTAAEVSAELVVGVDDLFASHALLERIPAGAQAHRRRGKLSNGSP